MLLTNLILAFCGLIFTLAGSTIAQPIDVLSNVTTSLAPRDFRYAPEDCTSKVFFCLTIETDHGHYGGFSVIHCNPHHTYDQGRVKTFYFNGRCDGQFVLNCPTKEGGANQRGLVDFSLGNNGPKSTYQVEAPGIKGITNDGQTVQAGGGSVTVNSPWSDAYFACLYA